VISVAILLYEAAMSDNPPETELDVSGLLCPLPVLKARKKLEAMASGAILKVIATDPMSAIDMPHFCTEQGHILLSHDNQTTHQTFRIKRR
jgi:tRNA 2-thiouridine synthesizing protein A